MEIIIQYLGFKSAATLETFVNDKLQKLEPLHHNIVRAHVTLTKGPESKVENATCEIRLEVAGNDPFVKKDAASFEQAISEATEALLSILKKEKEKLTERRQAQL